MTLIREINGNRVIIVPIKTSGTINAIKRILKEFKKKCEENQLI
ncbi:MAG: hypothetical protein ACFE9R_11370 [Candidatus Hermodarchaeota archaeon]